MTPHYIQIPVELDIYEYLKGKSTFEDTPSTVLRRELKLPASDNGQARAGAPAEDHDNDGDEATFPLPAHLAGGTRAREATARRKAKPVTKRSRAAAGTLLPESEYHRPILQVLFEHGGSAPKQVVIDEVGDRLKDRLMHADHEELDSGGIRWQSRMQFARLRLVDKGFIDKNAPRGIWAITPEATKALEEGTV